MDWLKNRNREDTEEEEIVYYTEWERETINYFEQRHQNLELSLLSKIMRGEQPVDHYFESDYLIELGNISEPNEKNALFALFTLLLYEYRRSEGIQERLKHITILEEAHRIIPSQTKQLDKDSPTSAEHEAATLVANMLAEIRAFGEGIIIVDQSPSKILSDALINCNTKIIHLIGYGEDKKTLAEALSLSKEQQNFLSSLKKGKAITIHPEINKPIYVSIPKA
jgi:DNA helicase HerA-like ATPase